MPQLETVLNKPLSGEDVRKIILSKLDTKLAGDSRLTSFIAFPAFSFKLDIAIILAGAVEPHNKVDHEITGGQNEKLLTDSPDQPATIVTNHIEQGPMPPNQARVDAGLGVPVLSRDERGREVEREVKYSKEVARVEPVVPVGPVPDGQDDQP